MKGVADGGINVPHSESRFFGFDQESKDYNAEAHRDRILGKHVADYMSLLKEEDEDRYKRQFSKFLSNGMNADNLVATYQKAHANIRADPSPSAKKAAKPSKRHTAKRLTYDERKQRVADKKALLLQLKEQQQE
ncbi:hypothetical protein L3Y34_017380 [Caenorhabditis briggsae]|nr:hypothetical protein L3Y34_017380 [Caenorhabditis briggsae]